MKSCGKYGNWFFSILLCIFLAPCATAAGPEGSAFPYEETVAQWKSYHDVAHWLAGSFVYDKSRHVPQSPAETFRLKKGVCYDAANFTIDALNRINPGYKAKSVFIKNRIGPPDHWVAAFTENGKLYILDYGAGMRWSRMKGIHGPYESLADYESFLSSLTMGGFILEYAVYRDF
ncbi:MAG: transglutaminase-like domain-containing protein [Syntrophales bacterium]|jgi:hypothetical protein